MRRDGRDAMKEGLTEEEKAYLKGMEYMENDRPEDAAECFHQIIEKHDKNLYGE